MRKLFFLFLITLLFSCNGQENKKNSTVSKTLKPTEMQRININEWKEKAKNYMNSLNEDGETVTTGEPYYYLKETSEMSKEIEFSGSDKEGYSLKEVLPKPNLYTDVKFYRSNGMLLYSFKTLVINPNIVVGKHDEYNEKGIIIKTEDYDEGFLSKPEQIVTFIKSHGGNIENELTIIDRQKDKNRSIWHVEFLVAENKLVKIFTLEDSTLKILSSQERSSDFLED